MTRLSFDGPAPSDDEVAAITTVILSSSNDDDMARTSRNAAWKLAARFPELSIEDVRALARGASKVRDVVR
ncbi:MAG: hypothetical protein ACXWNK_02480 [Vulcanimicrobiaceae bacterium]